MPWRFPALIGLVALCTAAVSLWLAGQRAVSEDGALQEEVARPLDDIAAAEMPNLKSEERAIVEAFAAQPSVSADGNGQPELMPEEWEAPLFDILLDEKQDMEQRNARLLELATGAAKGVPSVQQECLMHLVFGISDDNGAQFVAVATNPAIPVGMRAEFLKQALEMRPQELGKWLSQQVSNHYEPEISSISRLYLLDLKSAAQ